MSPNASISQAAQKHKGVVVLPIREYERLVAAALPGQRLKGSAATKLDMLVTSGLRESKNGKTRAIRSLAELD